MSANITWTVSAMDCYPTVGTETDVVFTVHWTCAGVQDTYNGSVYSTCSVPAPTGTFTSYADLTQDIVLGWIWASGVDKDSAEAAVQAQIDNQINPPTTTPPLPWTA
jgi:hypothetical protein